MRLEGRGELTKADSTSGEVGQAIGPSVPEATNGGAPSMRMIRSALTGQLGMSGEDASVATYLSGAGPYKLEIGAGRNGKPGWLSTDLYAQENPNGTTSVALDATKTFPMRDNSFDFVFSEHMIEHITYSSGRNMIRECFRVLKPGGVVRITTPSLGFLLRIMSPDRSEFEQRYLEWAIINGVPEAPIASNAFFLNHFMRAWGHTFIYDRDTLRLVLTRAGFLNVKECAIGSSEHEALTGLENVGRMPPGFLELESMTFEGTK
jgi:predicted SAM-dependent methyltransferase